MKKFDSLFIFLEEYKNMDHDEKIFCQKVLMSFNDSVPIGIVKSELEPFIPVEEQLPQESACLKRKAAWVWIQSQCDICWCTFIKRNNKQKYCSIKCLKKFHNWKNKKHIQKNCEMCWETFYTKKQTAKYCSPQCRAKSTKWANHWKNKNKQQPVTVVKKSDDPFFKPKFIFDQN